MGRSLGIRPEAAEVRGETLLCTSPFGLAMLQHAPHVGAPSLQLRRIFALLAFNDPNNQHRTLLAFARQYFWKRPLVVTLIFGFGHVRADLYQFFACHFSLWKSSDFRDRGD